MYKQYDPHTQTVNTVNVTVLDVQQSSLVDISFNNVTVKNIVKNICEDRAKTKLTKAPSNASFIWTEDLSVNRESSQTINYCWADGDKDFSLLFFIIMINVIRNGLMNHLNLEILQTISRICD